MSTEIILLERIENVGNMGDVVRVKPGYARNYLLPQNKALRATKDNIAYFEAQKASLEKVNEVRKKEAQKRADKIEGLKVVIIRQAAEGGQLYGSVTSRDISEAITEASKEKIERYMVQLNQNFKMIGLFPVEVALHPEVKVEVIINIARSEDEAKTQEKTGKALISDDSQPAPVVNEAKADEAAEEVKEELLEDTAFEAEKEAEKEELSAADTENTETEAQAEETAETK